MTSAIFSFSFNRFLQLQLIISSYRILCNIIKRQKEVRKIVCCNFGVCVFFYKCLSMFAFIERHMEK